MRQSRGAGDGTAAAPTARGRGRGRPDAARPQGRLGNAERPPRPAEMLPQRRLHPCRLQLPAAPRARPGPHWPSSQRAGGARARWAGRRGGRAARAAPLGSAAPGAARPRPPPPFPGGSCGTLGRASGAAALARGRGSAASGPAAAPHPRLSWLPGAPRRPARPCPRCGGAGVEGGAGADGSGFGAARRLLGRVPRAPPGAGASRAPRGGRCCPAPAPAPARSCPLARPPSGEASEGRSAQQQRAAGSGLCVLEAAGLASASERWNGYAKSSQDGVVARR